MCSSCNRRSFLAKATAAMAGAVAGQEVGYFIPPDPAQRYGPMPEGRLVVQTEDVLVDRRGFIYITDKNQGLWVLQYQGGPN